MKINPIKHGIEKAKNTEEEIANLKKVIRLTYKAFFYMAIFLALPTITYYILHWSILQYARDTGIIILLYILWRITTKMKKKEKEELKEKQQKELNKFRAKQKESEE